MSGNTNVKILTTSTANDKLTLFAVGLNTLTLTSQSGQTVSLLAKPIGPDFIHVNGRMEPQVTVSVPQGIYTSATISPGGAGFTCVGLASDGTILTRDADFGSLPTGDVTVTLPAPITITGTSMALLLDSLVSQSATFPSPCAQGTSDVSIMPAFVLTPITLSAQPTNNGNGKATQLQGMIASIDVGNASFSLSGIYDGSSWQAITSGSTLYQGVTVFSQLAVGMPVDMDVAIQPDGSLLATRVAVYDTDTTDLSVDVGPVLNTNGTHWQGVIPTTHLLEIGWGVSQGYVSYVSHEPYWNYGNAVFQISGQLTNVQSLPFPASFSTSNVVAGQYVTATTHDSAHLLVTVNGYSSATTITLLPQTINGTVSAVSSEGSFTTYTVTLASYDLFPTFAVQADQTTLLTSPNTVVIYADNNTQQLNTNPVAVGSVVRFYGLVFNDNGTLRMDCAQINDGVPE
ncbi:MAG TPA: hypothetical protein VHX20_15930 [Terracidiphilus sp.]|nr:hypothetical protein [Terracidiphilus sp.]